MKSRPAGKKSRRRPGALFWVALLLFGSAVLRLGIDVGPAIAREAAKDTEAEAVESHDNQLSQDPLLTESAVQGLIREIQNRESILAERERQFQDKMKALKIAETAIEQKMAELVEVEAALRETLSLADGASEADLSRLTSVYEQMKPKEAAALFETMDPAFSAGFMARMRPDAAAGILAKLSPQAAYSISAILAGRHALVPKN